MRVEVVQTLPNGRVEFRGEAGIWEVFTKSARLPVVGDKGSLELDVDDALIVGANTKVLSDGTYSLKSSALELKLCGRVDAVDEDGLVYVRFGTDSLTMMDAAPGGFFAGQWLQITVKQELVRAYFTASRGV